MRLIGILNWYDENPAWLAATTASMVRLGCSHIVGLDGAYALYPDAVATPQSGLEQHESVMHTAQALGAGVTMYAPSEPFVGNECEKRTLGFRLADQVAHADDWYVLMDADQVITSSARVFEDLAETPHDVATIDFYTRGADHRGLFPVRCVYRAGVVDHVGPRHMDYVSVDDHNLWGDPPYVAACPLLAEVEHRTHLRGPRRKHAQEEYYERRDRVGAEREETHV